MPRNLLARVMSDFGSSGAVTACMSAFNQLGACATPGAAMAELAGGLFTASPFASILVAGSLMEWLRAKGDKESLQAEFREVHKALGRIKDAQQSDADWRGLVDELLGERIKAAEQADPATLIDNLRQAMVVQGESITTQVEAGFATLNSQLDRIEDKVDVVVDGIERIESQLPQIADAQAKVIELAQSNASLAVAFAQLAGENATLRGQLVNANRELAEQRLAEGQTVDEVLAELRAKSPQELVDFLSRTVREEEAELEQAMVEGRERLIARYREIATIGFPLGQIAETRRSLENCSRCSPTISMPTTAWAICSGWLGVSMKPLNATSVCWILPVKQGVRQLSATSD